MPFTMKQLEYLYGKLPDLPKYILPEEAEMVGKMMEDKKIDRYFCNDFVGTVMSLFAPQTFNGRIAVIKDLQSLIQEYAGQTQTR